MNHHSVDDNELVSEWSFAILVEARFLKAGSFRSDSFASLSSGNVLVLKLHALPRKCNDLHEVEVDSLLEYSNEYYVSLCYICLCQDGVMLLVRWNH
mmetsp:Transcript_6743/g.13537  ORF Transcript_6743/g.13537 Transcript_6743/m.13537 type:complete len:97 (+) Transcript_6743:1374-1664(+)